ncbi:MAG: hypothetical protein J6U37_03890 [Lachnospiraceae bacterium]|nr:hypothetical protein [Lachnospiraceae bacterium]
MEAFLCTNIPVQMIACTDTDGRITPIRFRFTDQSGELVTINVEQVLMRDQHSNKIGATFECAATLYGMKRKFKLYYSNFSGTWRLDKVG